MKNINEAFISPTKEKESLSSSDMQPVSFFPSYLDFTLSPIPGSVSASTLTALAKHMACTAQHSFITPSISDSDGQKRLLTAIFAGKCLYRYQRIHASVEEGTSA
jgi:hypothetical protein